MMSQTGVLTFLFFNFLISYLYWMLTLFPRKKVSFISDFWLLGGTKIYSQTPFFKIFVHYSSFLVYHFKNVSFWGQKKICTKYWLLSPLFTYNTPSLRNQKIYIYSLDSENIQGCRSSLGWTCPILRPKRVFFLIIHSKLSGKIIFVTNFPFRKDLLKPPHHLNGQNMLSVMICEISHSLTRCSYRYHYPLPSFPHKVIISVLASYEINCINKAQFNHLTIKSQWETYRQGLTCSSSITQWQSYYLGVTSILKLPYLMLIWCLGRGGEGGSFLTLTLELWQNDAFVQLMWNNLTKCRIMQLLLRNRSYKSYKNVHYDVGLCN